MAQPLRRPSASPTKVSSPSRFSRKASIAPRSNDSMISKKNLKSKGASSPKKQEQYYNEHGEPILGMPAPIYNKLLQAK